MNGQNDEQTEDHNFIYIYFSKQLYLYDGLVKVLSWYDNFIPNNIDIKCTRDRLRTDGIKDLKIKIYPTSNSYVMVKEIYVCLM